jgi:hypothetical protein
MGMIPDETLAEEAMWIGHAEAYVLVMVTT